MVAPIMVLFFVALASSDPIPHLINYQGMLTDDGGNPLNTPQNLTFRIYNVESGGASLWDETQNNVPVEEGLFSVILGSVNPIDLPFDEDYWLETEVGLSDTLLPRVKLTSVSYAYRAQWADTSDYSFHAKEADTAFYAIEAVSAETDSDWTITGNDMYSAVSGNVGIGTTSPTAPLTIQPVNGVDIQFAGGGGFNADIMASNEFRIGTLGPSFFSIVTDNELRLVVDGSGKVGIGDTSPWKKLTVEGDVAVPYAYSYYVGAYTGLGWNNATGAVRLGDNGRRLEMYAGSATPRMVIDKDNGNVGIGTTSPEVDLDVYGTQTINATRDGIVNIGSTSGAHVTLDNNEIHGRNGSSTSNFYINDFGGNVLIAKQGNVGIGTSSPDAKLEVYTTESEHGVQSYSFSHTHSGVYGQSSRGVGVWGKHTDPSYTASGVFGENTGSGAGVIGYGGSGVGVVAKSTSGNPLEAWDRSPSNRRFYVNNAGNAYCDGSFTGGGADLAEMITVSSGASAVEPGDVMVIDPDSPRAILKSSEPRSTLVAGIYSTKPGFIGSERNWDKPTGGSEAQLGTYTLEDVASEFNEIPLAVVGIVLCKVSAENGPIGLGDLLVTSSTPGHAMRDNNPQVGTVLGKALESLASGTGVIKVLVTLH